MAKSPSKVENTPRMHWQSDDGAVHGKNAPARAKNTSRRYDSTVIEQYSSRIRSTPTDNGRK